MKKGINSSGKEKKPINPFELGRIILGMVEEIKIDPEKMDAVVKQLKHEQNCVRQRAAHVLERAGVPVDIFQGEYRVAAQELPQ